MRYYIRSIILLTIVALAGAVVVATVLAATGRTAEALDVAKIAGGGVGSVIGLIFFLAIVSGGDAS